MLRLQLRFLAEGALTLVAFAVLSEVQLAVFLGLYVPFALLLRARLRPFIESTALGRLVFGTDGHTDGEAPKSAGGGGTARRRMLVPLDGGTSEVIPRCMSGGDNDGNEVARQELEEADRRYAKLSADKKNLQEMYRKFIRKLMKAHRDALAALESARESKSSPSLCVVCHDNSSRVAIVPCGHMCLCTSCSATYFARQTSCPICRVPAQSTLKVYQ